MKWADVAGITANEVSNRTKIVKNPRKKEKNQHLVSKKSTFDGPTGDEEMLCKCFDKCCKAFIQ